VKINVICGDITLQRADALVTAGNKRLGGGSGVNGAIHRAAGPELLKASTALAPCPTGSAVITPAFNLAPVLWIIHAVGPVYSGRPEEAEQLMAAYQSALRCADEVGAATVAFPSISTGVYGYPGRLAADLSVRALATARTDVEHVLLVAYNEEMADMWKQSLHES